VGGLLLAELVNSPLVLDSSARYLDSSVRYLDRPFFANVASCAFIMAIPRPRMRLRHAQPRIPVYLSRDKDIKDAFKVCQTPDPCLVVEGQIHKRFPGVPRTKKSSILLTIRIHQIWWRVTNRRPPSLFWLCFTCSTQPHHY
jgi:hypothetical protein